MKKSDILGSSLSCRVSGPIRWLTALGLVLFSWQPAHATDDIVRINELMAGLNGNSSIQFFEMVAGGGGQKSWGANGAAVGRVMVVFFDSGGVQTGRFVVPTNPGSPANTVLFATQAFVDLTGITPDFIIPEGIMPIAGKVCFKNNPDNFSAFFVTLCLSYGGAGFTGSTEGAGAANAASLSILNSQSLSRNTNFSFGSQANADFVLATPTPNSTQNNPTGADTNSVGEAVLPVASSMADQGDDLFFKERFLGNGRTCGTCHFMSDNFGLTPVKVAALSSTDLLFMNQVNVNTLVVNSAGSVNPGAASGTTQPSDFFLGGTITGTLGGSATVLAGTGTTYLILGGSSLNVAGNVISDGAGNTGTLVSFTAGDLVGPNPVNGEARGIEDTAFLTGGRALITENINGFPETTFMRTSLNLLNLKHTAPYGLSGEFADLQSFANRAVQQHLPRRLQRMAGVDFRLPTAAELDAMAAFMDTIFLPLDENFDEANNFDKFVTTQAQERGRTLFFGTAKCGVCHNGKVLATSDGQFDTTLAVNETFNTGVANLLINAVHGLPTEQDIGGMVNSREFSTPPLFGVKNTAPFFHDNSVTTLLETIQFYDTVTFRSSPAFTQVGAINDVSILQNAQDIQAFLEGLVEVPFTFTRTLNFGSQAAGGGATSAMTVTLTHTGTEDLTIDSLTLNGTNPGEFANTSPMIDSGPFSNAQSRTIDVTFDPSSVGARQATLELTISSSSDSWDVGVALSGTGTGGGTYYGLGGNDFVYRWDEIDWTQITSAPGRDHFEFVAENEIYVLGGDGRIYKWNGSSFEGPLTNSTLATYFSYDQASGTFYGLGGNGFIYRWDGFGSGWTQITSAPGRDHFEFVAENEIYVLGGDGRIYQWNGSSFEGPLTNSALGSYFSYDQASGASPALEETAWEEVFSFPEEDVGLEELPRYSEAG